MFSLRKLLATVVAAAALFAGAEASQAQVLVYKMDFSKTGGSINFSFFDRAYFVVDALGGVGSFIFTYREDGRDFYLTAEDSGEMFFAVKPGEVERAVVRATATNGTAQSEYLAIGRLDRTVSFNPRGQRISAHVASTLRGNVLASDSEEDVSFEFDKAIGFAGFAELKATLDETRTDSANRGDLTVSGTIAEIVDDLTGMGFEEDTGDTGDDETESDEEESQ